jgi:hypothetical protein
MTKPKRDFAPKSSCQKVTERNKAWHEETHGFRELLSQLKESRVIFTPAVFFRISSMETSPSSQVDSTLKIGNEFLAFYGTRRFCSSPHSQQPATGSYPEPHEYTPNPPPPQRRLPKIHFDLILPSTSLSSEWFLSFGLCHLSLLHFSVLSHACHMPRPPHSPHCASFSILPLLHPTSVHIVPSAPCSQTPSVYALPLMLETKFHTHTKQLHHTAVNAISHSDTFIPHYLTIHTATNKEKYGFTQMSYFTAPVLLPRPCN